MEGGRVRLMGNKVNIIDGFNFTIIAGAAAMRIPGDEPIEDKLYTVLFSMLRANKKRFPDTDNWYVCWDSYGGKDFRSNIDNNYKANRDNSSIIDFKAIESSKPLYEEFGMKNITIPRAEADDVINTLCKILKEKNPQINITIFSRDHDMIQTVQSGLAKAIYDPVKKKNMEIPWYSIIDFKALVGDKSDNIPGVKGIGEKTALKILTKAKELTESQKVEFEKYKDMIDFDRNPRKEENYFEVLRLIN